jgi:hypothetical protein
MGQNTSFNSGPRLQFQDGFHGEREGVISGTLPPARLKRFQSGRVIRALLPRPPLFFCGASELLAELTNFGSKPWLCVP